LQLQSIQPRKQNQQDDRIELKKNGLRSGKRELAPIAAEINVYNFPALFNKAIKNYNAKHKFILL
jgi:hypothetical protein